MNHLNNGAINLETRVKEQLGNILSTTSALPQAQSTRIGGNTSLPPSSLSLSPPPQLQLSQSQPSILSSQSILPQSSSSANAFITPAQSPYATLRTINNNANITNTNNEKGKLLLLFAVLLAGVGIGIAICLLIKDKEKKKQSYK